MNPEGTNNSLQHPDKNLSTIMMVDDYPKILTLFEEFF